MKVTTDACLFGAWVAEKAGSMESGDGSSEPGVRRALDIGAGTGLLTLMLAQKTNFLIDAIEIDDDAFEQAKENINSSAWKDRITIFHADAKEFAFPSQYDIIISNPPFYENELKSDDAKKNLAHHEGLTLQQLLSSIKKNLSAEGQFFLLLPYKRNEETEKLIHSNGLSIIQKTLVRQSVNHDYFRIMIAGVHAMNKKEMIMDELAIRDEMEQYTEKFTALLKDYYLHL
jgi:tRNA1Val (adenine37-N6)-methyltransferase